MTSSNKNYLPSLDGLRAISVLIVVLGHAVNYGVSGYREYWFSFVPSGHLGVRIFFVISGFIITHLLIKEYEIFRNVSLKKFYLRRTFRIIPLTYIYILFVATVLWFFGKPLPWKDLAQAFTFTVPIFGDPRWDVGHLWSLAVEEQFYIFWPFLFTAFISNKRKLTYVLLAIVLLSFIIKIMHFSILENVKFLMNMDFLAFGCLMALYFNKATDLIASNKAFIYRPFILFLIYTSNFLPSYVFNGNSVAFALVMLFQAICISYLVLSYLINREGWDYVLLNNKWLSFIGKASFSIYLWQQFINGPVFKGVFNNNYWLIILVSLLIGIVSYLTIEKTFLTLKNRFKQVW